MGAPYGRPGPGCKAAILGIPFDCGTNMRIGARGGPESVRQQIVRLGAEVVAPLRAALQGPRVPMGE